MSPRQPLPSEVTYQLPPLTPLVRNLLVVLFVLYATELAARNLLDLPIESLTWHGLRQGFAPWQPLTRYLVQGQRVFGVVLAGVAVYFLLPAVERFASPLRILEAILVSALGGTLLTFGLDATGLLSGDTFGWPVLVTSLVVLFGLYQPDGVIQLFFVIPIPARALVWGTGVITGLVLLATLDLRSADYFGTFLGTLAWWRWRGPGARRRQLRAEEARLQQELRKFKVLDGGRSGSRKKDDDEWVH